jgi:hypothetical protein
MSLRLLATVEGGTDEESVDPSWDEIDLALVRLDGIAYSELSLERTPGQTPLRRR